MEKEENPYQKSIDLVVGQLFRIVKEIRKGATGLDEQILKRLEFLEFLTTKLKEEEKVKRRRMFAARGSKSALAMSYEIYLLNKKPNGNKKESK